MAASPRRRVRAPRLMSAGLRPHLPPDAGQRLGAAARARAGDQAALLLDRAAARPRLMTPARSMWSAPALRDWRRRCAWPTAAIGSTSTRPPPRPAAAAAPISMPQLGLTIDNGNHLVLSGNQAALGYLRRIGAQDRLVGPTGRGFPSSTSPAASAGPSASTTGRLPLWVFDADRRVPGTGPLDYLPLARLLWARAGQNGRRGRSPATDRFIGAADGAAAARRPEHRSAGGSAELAGAVIRETLATGGRPAGRCIARDGLAAALDRAGACLPERRGATLRLEHRLRAWVSRPAVSTHSISASEAVALGADDAVILAVPPVRRRR